MKPKILSLARDDLKEVRYRLSEFGNVPPTRFRDSFATFCDNIAKWPDMYPLYDLNPNYRRAVIIYDYLVFYQVEKDNGKNRAMVYRVLHGSRDILSLLDKEYG